MLAVSECTGTLEPLLNRVASTCPSLADPFEATAIVESFGYTDRIIREEFGVADSRALGQAIFSCLASDPRPITPGVGPRARQTRSRLSDDLRLLAQTCSLSLIYSLPWVATFVVERYRPNLLQIPADAAAPLTVALMASLILSGGFVQCIARKGQFYQSLGQPALGAAVCRRIWRTGFVAAVAAVAAGVAVGLYFEIFQPRPLLLAAVHFLVLTMLWMTCAVLWLDRSYWKVPAVFFAGGAAFWCSTIVGSGPLVSTMLATVGAFVAACVLLWWRQRRLLRDTLAPPRYAIFVRSLAPYFCYGCGYFSFVFADRIAAGTAVSTAAGVQFAIDAGYKLGMDVSLLLFLMSMTAVEFINANFMRFWHDEARRWTPAQGAEYRRRLRGRYSRSRLAVALVYAATACIVWLLLRDPSAGAGSLTQQVLLLGVAGYLLLELALFNALILFSVNAAVAVLRSLAPALLINAGAGYVLSNTLGPLWAAVSMASAAAVFLWLSTRKVRVVLERPGFCSYVA
jgi:hypothetical protein